MHLNAYLQVISMKVSFNSKTRPSSKGYCTCRTFRTYGINIESQSFMLADNTIANWRIDGYVVRQHECIEPFVTTIYKYLKQHDQSQPA